VTLHLRRSHLGTRRPRFVNQQSASPLAGQWHWALMRARAFTAAVARTLDQALELFAPRSQSQPRPRCEPLPRCTS